MISKYESFNSKKLDIEYIEECFIELLDDEYNSLYIESIIGCTITIHTPTAYFKTNDGVVNLLDKLGDSYTKSSNIFKSISNSVDKIKLKYKYDINMDISYDEEIITQIDMILININIF